MTEAMPFLQKTILLSYDPRPFAGGSLFSSASHLHTLPLGGAGVLSLCHINDILTSNAVNIIINKYTVGKK